MWKLAAFVAIVVVALGTLAVWWLPNKLAPALSQTALIEEGIESAAVRRELQSQRLEVQNGVRSTLLQALAGLVLVVGAVTGWSSFQASRDQQITERYTRAVDQLSSESVSVRVGGIYSLERISHDSSKDASTIAELLGAFVRETAVLVEIDELPNPDEPIRVRVPDLHAALTVLGRGDHQLLKGIDVSYLNFRGLDLRGAGLPSANLTSVDLSFSNLEGSNFDGADLSGAVLEFAVLRDAHLGGANLSRARLFNARMDEVDLQGANLTGAILNLVSLAGADMSGSNLSGAALNDINASGATFTDADLRGASLEDSYLFGADIRGADLRDADLRRADLTQSDLRGADLRGTYLEETLLNGASADGRTRWPAGFDPSVAGVHVMN